MSDVDVPADYLQFLLKQTDLWPATRCEIKAELKRRTTATASAPRGEDAEPLDARLRGDEERVVAIRCPRCGHDVDLFARLVRKKK